MINRKQKLHARKDIVSKLVSHMLFYSYQFALLHYLDDNLIDNILIHDEVMYPFLNIVS